MWRRLQAPSEVLKGTCTLNQKEIMQTQNAAVSAIQFALETDDGLAFLRCWNEGNFEAIRSEWPEAPESVFVGADPLHPTTAA